MYQLTLERFQHLLIAHLIGGLTLSTAVSLRHELEQIVMREKKARDIILNLSMVEDVDNSGLGVLVAVSAFARSHGKRFILCQLTASIHEALKHAAIDGFFPLMEEDEDLLAVMPD